MPAATQWRIAITASNGANSLAVQDFQFRTTVGSPRSFDYSNDRAWASDELDAATGAFDAQPITSWTTNPGVTAAEWYVAYNAGALDIVQFLVRAGSDPSAAPKDFTLEYSTDDGTTWTVADTRSNETGWAAGEIRAYTVGVAGHESPVALFKHASTKWRVNITRVKDRNNVVDAPDFVCLYEFKLGTDDVLPTLDQYGGTVTASSADASYPPSKAINSDAYDGGWETPAGTTAGWIQYEFPQPYAPLLYGITGGGPYDSSFDWIKYSSPVDWTLQYWNDATGAWVTLDTHTAYDTETAYQGVIPDQQGPETTGGGSGGGSGGTTDPIPTTGSGDVNFGDPANQGPAYFTTPFVVGQFPDGASGDGDNTLPLLAVSGSLQGPLSLQALGLAANGLSGTTAQGAAAFEQLSLSGDLSPPLTLEQFGIAASGFAGMASTADATLQPFDATANALSGTASDGAALFAQLDLAADAGMAGASILQPVDAAGAGFTGVTAAAALLFERMTLDAAGMPDQAPTTADATLATLSLAATVLPGTVANGAAALSALAANASGPAADLEHGDGVLPALDAIATALSGQVADGNALLAAASLAGVLSAPPPDNLGDGSLLLAAIDLQPATGLPGSLNDGAASLSPLVLSATAFLDTTADGATALAPMGLSAALDNVPLLDGDGDVALLPLRAAGDGLSGTASEGTVTLAAPVISASGIADAVGTADATLPALSLAGVMQFGGAPTTADGNASLSALTLSADLLPGAMADGAAPLLPLSLSAAGYEDGFADASLQFSALSLSGAAFGIAVIAGAAVLNPVDATAAGASGAIGAATIDVPLLQVTADGFADALGTATLSLPVIALDAAGVAEVASPSFVGIALNTHNRAVSTYAGLAFNSMTQFNGLVLAATDAGIVALTGDLDRGLPIAATVTAGVSDLGDEKVKRVLAGYVGYRASGAMELTMITDGHEEYVYRLEPRRLDDLHASRVKFGRGAEGRYWQWKLANRDGADFALDALTLDAAPLSRRVR